MTKTDPPAEHPAKHPERQRRLLYGRRKGPKLRGAQAALLETLLPKLTLHLDPGADPRRYFAGAVDDVWLEIGFGAGEHLHELARANPNVGLIGAEPFINGVAKLLAKLAPGEGDNIRIHMNDARDILDALPDASLGRVMILFPDPWPKTRHAKRRFIQMETLDVIARVTKPGGELRFATDDPIYLAWALERLCAHASFTWTATKAEDWRTRHESWPQTRYEAKAIRGVPSYFTFVRV
jgi:tRNA (guanine-N7-)-methyltransferase